MSSVGSPIIPVGFVGSLSVADVARPSGLVACVLALVLPESSR